MTRVAVKVAGKVREGWKGIQISRSIDECCGTWQIPIRSSGTKSIEPLGLNSERRLEILLRDKLVMTGFMDSNPGGYTADSHDVQVKGRDITSGLVDGSYPGPRVEWTNQKAENIITDLLAPWGLKLIVKTDTGAAIPKYRHNEGDAAWISISKIVRSKGFLAFTDPTGALVIDRTGSARSKDPLVLGDNAASCDFDDDISERHSHYIVKSQTVSRKDDLAGEGVQAAVYARGEARDPGVKRYRPLVVIADQGLSSAECKAYANWLARNRAAQATSRTYSVKGWTQSNGSLWALNLLVHVKDRRSGTDGSRLIVNVDNFLGAEEQEYSSITVCDPRLYEKDPTEKIEIPEVEDSGLDAVLGE